MPELSSFYGIRIFMRFEQGSKHHKPHFHVYYGGREAVYSLDGTCLAGRLPPKQDKLVQTWTCLHEEELKDNRYLAIRNCDCYRIAPLR